MKNHREMQIYKALKENRALLLTDVTAERAREMVRTLPVGSIWLWAAQSIYGPIGSALPEERQAAE